MERAEEHERGVLGDNDWSEIVTGRLPRLSLSSTCDLSAKHTIITHTGPSHFTSSVPSTSTSYSNFTSGFQHCITNLPTKNYEKPKFETKSAFGPVPRRPLFSFHEDLSRLQYHIEVFHNAKAWIHRRCYDSLLERITMSPVNRQHHGRREPEHPDGPSQHFLWMLGTMANISFSTFGYGSGDDLELHKYEIWNIPIKM